MEQCTLNIALFAKLKCPPMCITSQLAKLIIHQIPYSGKVWQGASLANLVNHPWFTKLKPSKLIITINNLLDDLLIHQTLFHQMLEKSQFTKLSPTKLSCYTVYCVYGIACFPSPSALKAKVGGTEVNYLLWQYAKVVHIRQKSFSNAFHYHYHRRS